MKTSIPNVKSAAFTLVELLVVVAIIVVLLALLMPAMDRAIYQAELAVDGANLKTIGAAAMTYATSNKRSYPDRFTNADTTYMPEYIRSGNGPDDRVKFQPYLDMKALVDPLAPGKIDLSIASTDADCWVNSTYALYFGQRFYDNTQPQQGMLRLGDKLKWQGEKFSVLAMEHDRINEGGVWAMSSHPDRDGKMAASVWQNRYQVDLGIGIGASKYTLSRWELVGAFDRGLVDYQAVADDGGVRRYLDVSYKQWKDDPSWSRVPNYVNGQSWQTEYHQMPLR